MTGRSIRPVPESPRTTARAGGRRWWERTDRSERGDTLIEVLLALVVLALAALALIIAFTTSIAASAEHRRLASDDTVLATASQELISAIENQPTLFTDACTTPLSGYPYYSANQGFPLPAPYTNETNQTGYMVQYSTTTSPIEYWNGTAFTSTCEPDEPQLITIQLTGTNYTNSFVVDYPVGSTGGSSSTGGADHLIFLIQPGCGSTGCYAGTPIGQQPVVEVVDSSGVPVTTDLSPVVLSVSTASPTQGVLSGCSGNEVLGVVTFSGCTLGSGGWYTLTASDPTTTTQTTDSYPSPTFDVTAANFELVFTTQPVAAAAGSPFSAAPQVAVENISDGQINTAWAGSVTLTASGGEFTNCPAQTGLTTVIVSVSAGIAQFPSGCDFWGGIFYNANTSHPVTATQYTMSAVATPSSQSDAAIPATSNAFSVTAPGPAYQLSFATSPTGVASSNPATVFSVQPVVQVEDAFGNVATSATDTISIAMYQGTTSETLNNCSYSLSEGTYTYSGCQGNALNNGLDLVASDTSSGLLPATSGTFNITGVATQLLFTTSPEAGASASSFSVQPVLVFEDANNSVVTAETSTITLSVSPSSGILANCTDLVPDAGYVHVENCTFAGLVGTQYTMTATGGGLTSLPSAAFSPTGPGPATQLVFTQEPVAGAADAVLLTQPIVTVEDSAGNVVTTSTNVITLTSSGNGLISNCAGLTVIGGNAIVSNCTFGGVVGTQYQITASSGSLTPAVSTDISPTGPGPMSVIILTANTSAFTQTTNATLTATLTDNFGNVETPDSSTPVTFSALPSSTGTVTGLVTTNDASGVAADTVTGSSAGYITFQAAAGSVTSNQVTLTVDGPPTITTTSLPGATQSGHYNQTLVGSGGTTPYTWSLASGTLPGGLSLSSSGVISGTVANSATTQSFTVKLTDADGVSTTQPLTITVNAPPIVTTTSLATATQDQTGYSQTLAASNGTTPFTWTISAGSLPNGLGLAGSTGVISGNVAGNATTQTFTVKLTDADGVTATKSLTLTVNVAPTIGPSTLPSATQTGTYSQTLTASGGTAPFGAWNVASGTLPSGLSLNTSSGVISGTVAANAATETFSVQITDANNVTASKAYTLTVTAAPSVTTTALATATDGETTYSQTLAATGGVTPYTWSLSSGSLPSGLGLSSGGVISGTVTATDATGPYTFTVEVTDSNGVSGTKSLTITVNAAPSVTTTSLATATQTQTGYSQTLAATGGVTPYTWSLNSGSLPSGLAISSGGVISGTVGAGATTQTFTVKVTDANGVAATKSLTITVNVKPTVSPTTLPGVDRGSTYNQSLSVSGGTTPFGNWSETGTLPSGLSFSTAGVISGTVTATDSTGNYTFTAKVTDANGVVASQSLTITVNAAPAVTTTTLAAATDGQSGYSQTLAASGGTTPYTWSLASGTLPGGLGLSSAGVISGNVASNATTQTFTVTVTDADGQSGTKSLTITVNAAPVVTTSSLATADDGQNGYTQTLGASGGTTPLTWSIASGTLPGGLGLTGSTGVISGNVASNATTQTMTVEVADANGVTATKSLTITVNAAPTISPTTLPGATLTGSYSQTLTVSGGTTPYSSWSLQSGALPGGLTLSTGGVISGTVTGGTSAFVVKVTDAIGVTATRSYTITVNAAPSISPTTLPGATLTGSYSQTLTVSGGTAPFGSWSLQSGALPSGLGLSSGGVISGTVTGSDTTGGYAFVVQVTDANGVTGTRSYTLTVNTAPSVTTTTLANADAGQIGYTQTLTASGGTASLTWSISSGALPNGLSLAGATGTISGTVGLSATSQTLTVKVTDANGVTATKSLTITVNAGLSYVLSNCTFPSPAPGTIKKSTTYSCALTASGGSGSYSWTTSYSGGWSSNPAISPATGTGSVFTITGTTSASNGTRTVTVTLSDPNAPTTTVSETWG